MQTCACTRINYSDNANCNFCTESNTEKSQSIKIIVPEYKDQWFAVILHRPRNFLLPHAEILKQIRIVSRGFTMDGEHLLVTGAAREKSSQVKQWSSLDGEGETRNGWTRDRTSRGSTRREKYTSVANESRDD